MAEPATEPNGAVVETIGVPEKTEKDHTAFKRTYILTGNIRQATLAAGYGQAAAGQGISKIHSKLKDFVKRHRAGKLMPHELRALFSDEPNALPQKLPNGQWPPGVSGNPDGLGRIKRISEAILAKIEKEGAEKYADVLDGIATDAKPLEQISAINTMLDRTEGKPVQAVLVGHTIDESAVRTIAELLGKLYAPPTIEAQD